MPSYGCVRIRLRLSSDTPWWLTGGKRCLSRKVGFLNLHFNNAMEKNNGIKFGFLIAGLVSLTSFSNIMNAQTETNKNQKLNAGQQSIVSISALTATGDLENLRKALSGGLDAGLTVNEIKEVLVQMYAYCGFPRSLNGINTFMAVLEERKKKSITDMEGKTATSIAETGDKYERGRKTLEKLTGQPQSKPAKGFGEFSPQIDRFLKEHLFADIFDSDVLSYQQRELATISALAAIPGVESQLESHLSIGMNTGLTESQLSEVFNLIEKNVSKQQAGTARKSLTKVIAARQKK
jgi:4-carboxymuconolactone decarboxylase